MVGPLFRVRQPYIFAKSFENREIGQNIGPGVAPEPHNLPMNSPVADLRVRFFFHVFFGKNYLATPGKSWIRHCSKHRVYVMK